MKILYLLCLIAGSTAFAQTITFKGCINLFDDQTFIFNKTGVDTNNKSIYVTTPVDGEPCSGLGTCEFKIQWNNTLTRWEFLADEGYGTFTNPKLVYYNSTGNNSVSFPPGNNIGSWVENTAFTTGLCNGNLTAGNSTMTGDVQTTTLGTSELTKNKIQIFPNPVTDLISIRGIDDGTSIQIYTIDGRLVKSEMFDSKIDVSQLAPGGYVLKINTRNFQTHQFKFVKK
ncbi:T9SS C-terminal target domain-containing protein [Chryseobacterium cucumeris]|uniref:T9SS C-terminal target domain-containing protein n=1 Tax=Chryseobacterium cucumeris TaxID=1813611 RepID=A0ABX9X3Q9_9FLAO|nr:MULTISPECIES: T9SS type A sorting domain-containing protein [Chryseobacterium]QWT85203.1 T9SS type A sorting domain-containing protein [Chryseobacterium sp. PCH239]ROH89792.1 T9SS C-terminal target domain-containing protein [Chryseobacterium cucumeris]